MGKIQKCCRVDRPKLKNKKWFIKVWENYVSVYRMIAWLFVKNKFDIWAIAKEVRRISNIFNDTHNLDRKIGKKYNLSFNNIKNA